MVFSLYSDVLTCRAPTTNYDLFLGELYLFLKIKAVEVGKPTNFKTIEEFFQCCNEKDEQVQHILCELYLHNFFLEEERDSKPCPFIGDVQFQAFLYFSKNQTRWAKAYKNF